ncbi:hypothetical protein QLQ85_15840 [Halomonas sp. M4R5S39]|uniref:hypothetical protein n=1 Tax=Halomonas kalidii TaxID=3043293 RepID=UPI0024A8BB97|nr:hypothetical protein [Halomonas kalidii]MDI5986265.1 hypothetical protein [Halomonas kalidii]
MMFTVRFASPYQIAPFRDAIDIAFPYEIVPSEFVGAPEERSQTKRRHLKIGISRTLASCWGLTDSDLIKVLFEYGKRYLSERIKDRALSDELELWLTTATHPQDSPFDPKRIPEPDGANVEIEEPTETLGDKMADEAIAAEIIEARDNVNALYHQKYGANLVVLRQERDLLQLFRDCTSQEELFYRITSLRNAAVNCNVESLRKVTGVSDSKVQSIGLLERYLQQFPGYTSQPIVTLKALNKIRQGFPVHSDTTVGLIEGLTHFELRYPVNDPCAAWKKLLVAYRDAMKEILRLVQEDTLPPK